MDDDTDEIRHRLWRAGRPEQNHASVTGFSDWIFESTVGKSPAREPTPPSIVKKRRSEGAFAHAELHELLAHWGAQLPKAKRKHSWKIYYSDPHDPTQADGRTFHASTLTIDDTPITGRPDVVLRDGNHFIIVERKFTHAATVPEAGWPNLRAQLWCYSWMDEWVDADEVYLLAEIYRYVKPYKIPGFYRPWYWKQANVHPKWRRNDDQFHATWCEFFQYYGGHVGGKARKKAMRFLENR